MGKNCDVYATVNFGKGPVEIRCTETGEHLFHHCEVQWQLDEPASLRRQVQHQNVFEKKEDTEK